MLMSLSTVKLKISKLGFLIALTLAFMLAFGINRPAIAQSDAQVNKNTDTASAQLELFVDQVLSASGKFQQTVKNDANADNKPETQSGDFAFQRPGKFIWNVNQPYDQLVVSNGSQIYQYDPDLEQVTQRSSGSSVSNSPAALLFGSGSLADTFEIKDLPNQNNTHWLQAVPKQKDAGFVHVDIGFKNGLPVQLNLLDSFGQTTEISFTDFKINPEFSADKFKFTVPEGVDLVKMD